MKTFLLKGLGFVVLIGIVMAPGGIKDPEAGGRDELDVKAPPRVTLHGPHPVVEIPGTYVYMVPDIDVSILFFGGYWYRPYEGRWFRAESYNGPWVYIKPSGVPWALIELPPEYRREPGG